MRYRHVPWMPHTIQDGIFFSILPYLNISDFSWLNIITFDIIPLETCKESKPVEQGVTIFTNT